MKIKVPFRGILHNASIRIRITVSMSALIGIAMTILGIVIFTVSKKMMEYNYKVSHIHDLQVSCNIIDLQLNSIVDLSRTLLTNDEFKKIMEEEKSSSPYFSSFSSLKIDDQLRRLLSLNLFIQTVFVVNTCGKVKYYTKLSNISGKMSRYYQQPFLKQEKWIQTADKTKGKEIFYGYNILYKDDSTISLVKTLINPQNGTRFGYLVLLIKKNILKIAVGNPAGGYAAGHYFVVDRNPDTIPQDLPGTLVYSSDPAETGYRIFSSYISRPEHSPYLFSVQKNETGNWEIVNAIRTSEVQRDSLFIGLTAVAAGAIMMGILLFLTRRIAARISRPLEQLEKTIRDVGEGNYKVETVFDTTEIGCIGTQFKNMVNNNLDLHEKLLKAEIKERESALLLLQSQINPHFLYNTLDSLYFMAVIKKAYDIADMVQALSDIFKQSLNNGSKLISVRDEIEKILAYMKIQNFRYHDRFALTIDIDEPLMDKKILSFILQPIVENAVYHGLEPKIGKGKLSITGSVVKNTMTFIIRDDGVGLEDLSKIDSGYGIRNIRERIKLYYGELFGIRFESTPAKGTTVTIRLPLYEESA